MKRVVALIMLFTMMVTGSGVALATNDIVSNISKAEVYTVKEKTSAFDSIIGNTIKYTKSEVEGHDLTVYTIIKGKYRPVDIVEFLRHDNEFIYTVISQEKTTYLQEDENGIHRLYINESGASMEPIVLSLGNGRNIAIRWSREFLDSNKIPLKKGHELFEEGYEGSRGINNIINEISYINYVGDAMVTLDRKGITIKSNKGEQVNYKLINSDGVESVTERVIITEKVKEPESISNDDLFGYNKSTKVTTKVDVPKHNTNTNPTNLDGPIVMPVRPGLEGFNSSILDYFLRLGERGDSSPQIPTRPGTVGGINSGNQVPSNSNDSISPKHFNDITHLSTKDEISKLNVNELGRLYIHAMKYTWANSDMINEIYNEKLVTTTTPPQESVPNQSTVPGSGVNNSGTPVIGGADRPIKIGTGCDDPRLNEVERMLCKEKENVTEIDRDYYSDTSKREDVLNPGEIGNATIIDLDNFINNIGNIGENNITGEDYNFTNNEYDIGSIITGNYGVDISGPKKEYKVTYGETVTDEIFKDSARFDEEMLLLTAYQELSFGVYNEKMEAINPNQIPVVKPSVKKINFLIYDNVEVKSQLLLKYVSFFAVLILVTLIFLVMSRTIQETKKKEDLNGLLKFKEEEIIFTDYINDNTLGVE